MMSAMIRVKLHDSAASLVAKLLRSSCRQLGTGQVHRPAEPIDEHLILALS